MPDNRSERRIVCERVRGLGKLIMWNIVVFLSYQSAMSFFRLFCSYVADVAHSPVQSSPTHRSRRDGMGDNRMKQQKPHTQYLAFSPLSLSLCFPDVVLVQSSGRAEWRCGWCCDDDWWANGWRFSDCSRMTTKARKRVKSSKCVWVCIARDERRRVSENQRCNSVILCSRFCAGWKRKTTNDIAIGLTVGGNYKKRDWMKSNEWGKYTQTLGMFLKKSRERGRGKCIE